MLFTKEGKSEEQKSKEQMSEEGKSDLLFLMMTRVTDAISHRELRGIR